MKFQKGVSGNPRGRPKGSLSIVKIIKDELAKRINVVEDGKEKKVQLAKVLVRKMIQKAIQGDTKILIELVRLIEGEKVQMELSSSEPIVFRIISSEQNGSESNESIREESD